MTPHYNAHALGAFKLHRITNSLEAFQHSYKHGFRHFEVDVSVTQDGHFVASHDVEHVALLTKKDFLEEKGIGGATPVSIEELQRLMKTYPDINVMYDPSFLNGKHDDDALQNFIHALDSTLNERFIVEAYSPRQVDFLNAAGIKVILWLAENIMPLKEYAEWAVAKKVYAVSITEWRIRNNPDIVPLLRKNGIKIYSGGWNRWAKVKEAEQMGVDFITTDILVPGNPLLSEWNFWKFRIIDKLKTII